MRHLCVYPPSGAGSVVDAILAQESEDEFLPDLEPLGGEPPVVLFPFDPSWWATDGGYVSDFSSDSEESSADAGAGAVQEEVVIADTSSQDLFCYETLPMESPNAALFSESDDEGFFWDSPFCLDCPPIPGENCLSCAWHRRRGAAFCSLCFLRMNYGPTPPSKFTVLSLYDYIGLI